MTPWERRLQYVANLLVCGTGVLYAVMRYFMKPTDEFAVVNHPWQPWVQHAHVLVAPLLVFACGSIWRLHVAEHWKRATRMRRSGPGLAIVFVPMAASGYLLQTSVSDGWRQAWIVVHVASSAVWLVAFATHMRGPVGRFAAPLPAQASRLGRDERGEAPADRRFSQALGGAARLSGRSARR